jgi:hypothetical protein
MTEPLWVCQVCGKPVAEDENGKWMHTDDTGWAAATHRVQPVESENP